MKQRDYLNEVRGFTPDQLTGKINESKKKLIDLEQQKMLGQLKNLGEIKALKRQTAQALTLRDEKLIETIKE